METPIRYRFSQKEKLKSRKQIESLFANGKSFSNFPLRVIWSASTTDTGLQVGVSVGTRHFKRAVDRNRVKRLMREAIRLQKNHLQQQLKDGRKGLQLFLIYQSNEIPVYDDIYQKTGKILQRLIKLLNENPE